jgi:hypothetical protein
MITRQNGSKKLLSTACPEPTVRAVALFLMALGVILVIGHIFAVELNRLHPNGVTEILRAFFELNQEANVPTWFSSLQLALISLACAGSFVCEKMSGAKYRLVWLGFSLLFLFLSLDETAQFHERLDQIARILRTPAGQPVPDPRLEPAHLYSYLLLYIPGFLVVSAAIIGLFFTRAKDRATRLLVVAGLGCFAIKMGFESIEPWNEETLWFGHRIMIEIIILQMYGLMLGETLILTALLNHLAILVRKLFRPSGIALNSR